VVFDSNAILLYLAEKTGLFLPPDTPAERAQMYSWLMFVASGIGPYCGQAIHFKLFAPEPKVYAVNRYTFEAERHWGIVNDQLAGKRWMLGDTYTLVDMAVWGWSRLIPRLMGEQGWVQFPHVKRHLDAINARPAAQRAEALKDRFIFKQEIDDEAKRALFPQNARLAH
jgi:GSH-dependent disulfide-bond oxidoreductase